MSPRELTKTEFKRFQEFIYSLSGIRIPEAKIRLLSNRIRKRFQERELAGFRACYDYITSPDGRDELEGFLDAVTTNETFFFRTGKHFEWFQPQFITELIQQERRGERGKTIRVWSAVCSTGEEPYTLANCLLKNQLRLSRSRKSSTTSYRQCRTAVTWSSARRKASSTCCPCCRRSQRFCTGSEGASQSNSA